MRAPPDQNELLRSHIRRLASAYLAKWQFQQLEPRSPADTLVSDDGSISDSPYVQYMVNRGSMPALLELPVQPSAGSFRELLLNAARANIQTIHFRGLLVHATPELRLVQTTATQSTMRAMRASDRSSVE